MPSGGGHDAQMPARVCPTGMVFIPSVDRRSPRWAAAQLGPIARHEAGANVVDRLLVLLEESATDNVDLVVYLEMALTPFSLAGTSKMKTT